MAFPAQGGLSQRFPQWKPSDAYPGWVQRSLGFRVLYGSPAVSATVIKSPRRLADLASAAEYVGCHPRTIRRYISSGMLTGFRMGQRLIRVDLDEVDNILRPIPTAGHREAS